MAPLPAGPHASEQRKLWQLHGATHALLGEGKMPEAWILADPLGCREQAASTYPGNGPKGLWGARIPPPQPNSFHAHLAGWEGAVLQPQRKEALSPTTQSPASNCTGPAPLPPPIPSVPQAQLQGWMCVCVCACTQLYSVQLPFSPWPDPHPCADPGAASPPLAPCSPPPSQI